MMKNIDISNSVMDRVVHYEESHTARWLIVFFTVVAIAVGIISLIAWNVYVTGAQMHTWDLLGLFSQDQEIVAEFWQDTLDIVFAEIPPAAFIFGGMLLFALVVIIARTRKKRKVITRVRGELAKHRKNRNNK